MKELVYRITLLENSLGEKSYKVHRKAWPFWLAVEMGYKESFGSREESMAVIQKDAYYYKATTWRVVSTEIVKA